MTVPLDAAIFNSTLSIQFFTKLSIVLIMLCLMNHRTIVRLYCSDVDPKKKKL